MLSLVVDYARFVFSQMSRTAKCCPEIDPSEVMGYGSNEEEQSTRKL